MKKQHILWIIIMTALVILFSLLFSRGQTAEKLILIREKSFFSEYSIVEDQVLIRCEITVKNSYDTSRQFTLEAALPEDMKGGLLKEETLIGWNESLEKTVFTIGERREEQYIVVFVGTFAGNKQKQNRSLPEITITDISE